MKDLGLRVRGFVRIWMCCVKGLGFRVKGV